MASRALAVGVTVVVVLGGIWVTGGLITNDFGVSMALTAVWLGLTGLTALALAVRRRRIGVPILVAYLVTAGVAGVYLGRSMFLDDEVDENVAVAEPPAPREPERPRNVRLASGSFESLAHPASGTATAIRLANGRRVLTLTRFEVDNGPDLRVYLVSGKADQDSAEGVEDLGGLKGNKGNQQYTIPRDVDVRRHATVMIWCRAFSVGLARARLAG